MRASDCTHQYPLMSASAIGRDSGGPWCSHCGANLTSDTLVAASNRLAAAVAELVRVAVNEPLRRVGAWMDRHDVLGSLLMLGSSAVIVFTILLSGGQPL